MTIIERAKLLKEFQDQMNLRLEAAEKQKLPVGYCPVMHIADDSETESRRKEGRCVQCGTLRVMTALGLKDCEKCDQQQGEI